jgi:hypothetical protein
MGALMRLARAFLAVLLLGAPGAVSAAGDVDFTVPAAVLQAEMLERVTRFVDWPAESESSPAFVIAVLADDDVARELRSLAKTRRFRGKPTEIRSVSAPKAAAGAQVLWIGAVDRKAIPRLLAEAELHGVLTAGDGEGLARQGLVLDFYRAGDRLRFEINEAAARRQALRLPAKLLGLARLVEDAP